MTPAELYEKLNVMFCTEDEVVLCNGKRVIDVGRRCYSYGDDCHDYVTIVTEPYKYIPIPLYKMTEEEKEAREEWKIAITQLRAKPTSNKENQ